MTPIEAGLLYLSVAVTAACVIGGVHTAVSRAIARHVDRATRPLYDQPRHVRVVPRQEANR